MSLFKGQFGPGGDEPPLLPEEEDAVLEKLAQKVVQWRMAAPAILFLESVKPLNYIGSQAMVFFEPVVQTIFSFRDYDTLRAAMEKRECVEILLQKIERHDAILYEREKKIKKFVKTEKKKWKWYQRYLGINTPKIVLPEDIAGNSESDSTEPPPR
jgi:hypothetical protein